jgi:hypothetical protein
MPAHIPGLKGKTLDWLLRKDNPCVRYRALTELLDRPEDDPQVRAARDAAWKWPPAARVLEMAADPEHYAWPGGIRLVAAQAGRDIARALRAGIPPEHPALRCAAEYLKTRLPDSRGSDCYLPQMVTALVRFGDPRDPDVTELVEKVAANEVLADGNRSATVAHGRAQICCGSHSCHSAAVRAIDCVASVPEASRNEAMRSFLRRGGDYLAAHRLYQKNHHRFRPIRSGYTLLHQPWALDWKTDILDMLDVATGLGMADSPALADALSLLLEKQRPDGRWNLEQEYRTDRPLVANLLRDVERAGRPGKWVTLTALLMFRRCAGLVERLTMGEAIPYEPPTPPAGFPAYPWRYSRRDEARIRTQWAGLDGMEDVLDGLVGFARKHGVYRGWYQGFVMGPRNCREWCSSMTKLVPAKTMRAAFPVARTTFLAPRGQFTADDLVERLGGGPWHEYPTYVRPGSWVQKALWRVRVDRWNDKWDTVGVAIRSASEMRGVSRVMAAALEGARRTLP